MAWKLELAWHGLSDFDSIRRSAADAKGREAAARRRVKGAFDMKFNMVDRCAMVLVEAACLGWWRRLCPQETQRMAGTRGEYKG